MCFYIIKNYENVNSINSFVADMKMDIYKDLFYLECLKDILTCMNLVKVGRSKLSSFGATALLTVHGKWSDWAGWSQCSLTCGAGVQTRDRKCNNPAPSHNGNFCTGDPYEIKPCIHGCPGSGR